MNGQILPSRTRDLDAIDIELLANEISRLAGKISMVAPGDRKERPAQKSATAQAVRGYLRARRWREELFPDGLFADPAWDILLDLYASEMEGQAVYISSACIASSVPATTCLRWIAKLVECG